jgi:hypothetical protein
MNEQDVRALVREAIEDLPTETVGILPTGWQKDPEPPHPATSS